MAHQRGHSTSDAKEPHSVSLKVLRLSRPSLSHQHVLPTTSQAFQGVSPNTASSLAYPHSQSTEDNFIIAPLLTLPQAFGSAYIGETFSCTLCANNELPAQVVAGGKIVRDVRIEAEMKVPSSATPIPLALGPDVHSRADTEDTNDKGIGLQAGESLQRIVQFKLEEEGSHVLSVTVTYSESTPTSGRVRTFRKLYQFVSKNCVTIRTKSTLLPTKTKGVRRWALEAQLQNDGEDSITLDDVEFECRSGVKATGLNWDAVKKNIKRPLLSNGEVEQVCFVIESTGGDEERKENERLAFGRLAVKWRGQMGSVGNIETGELSGKLT